ncbi:MAG: tyrosine-type recombinase/integrase [Actinobacteria bacterium]|nr:tyrosine-type recombinase/integrase [Actinomycetota bacterium]
MAVTGAGTPMDHRAAGRRLDRVVKAAGLDVAGETRITPHQLRYTFGSLLLEAMVPVSRVSRLMGHANEAITLGVYAHEIERHENAERTRESMRTAFGSGTFLERSGEKTQVTGAEAELPKVASLRAFRER